MHCSIRNTKYEDHCLNWLKSLPSYEQIPRIKAVILEGLGKLRLIFAHKIYFCEESLLQIH